MRIVTSQTTNAWKAAFKGGTTRPMMRATIQKLSTIVTPYSFAGLPGVGSNLLPANGTGKFRTMHFGQGHTPVELPNLAAVNYQRSIGQDIATCTITLFNNDPLPIGATPEPNLNYERPGYYTFNRGDSSEAQSRWGIGTNDWRGLLAPDRVVRLYEGYGFDTAYPPETDPHLYAAGCWLIDDVVYTSDGMITLTCRDIGRVLLDYICYPPIVPWDQYPLEWQHFDSKTTTETSTSVSETDTTTIKWFRPNYGTDSNIDYIGKGFTDGPRPYVEPDGEVLGHGGRDAFDDSMTSYWLSVGNEKSWSSAYEYIQGKFTSRNIAAIKVKSWGGPYTVYISVYAGGEWKGRSKIPYVAQAVDTNADIKYVMKARIGKDDIKKFTLPKVYKDATRIRVTFSDLYNSGIGEYPYRAGCRDIKVAKITTDTFTETDVTTTTTTELLGNYADYTDIVKWFLVWSGWWWPNNTNAYLRYSNGTTVDVPNGTQDPVLGYGRAWGDFEQTNAYGVAPLSHPVFNQKSIMDCIAIIRDIVGFNFFIDEGGAAVWRSPNIWTLGNYVSNPKGGPVDGTTASIVTIDERETLLGMSTKLSSRSIRERYFVANTNGEYGALAQGYNPHPSGLMRVAGWTDQYFNSTEECQIMADLIALRAKFMYRTNSLSIPGNPSIQIDDQVRIFERVTSETYYHYVRSVTCDWDVRSGRYTYTLETHWLGETPFANWVIGPDDIARLAPVTRNYLSLLTGQAF